MLGRCAATTFARSCLEADAEGRKRQRWKLGKKQLGGGGGRVGLSTTVSDHLSCLKCSDFTAVVNKDEVNFIYVHKLMTS